VPEPEPTDPPAEPFDVVDAGTGDDTVCASFAGATGEPRIAVAAAVAGTEDAMATRSRTEDGVVLADRVLVPGGAGAVVESLTAGTAGRGTLFLVTDQGLRFAVPDERVLAQLGYAGVQPVRMPASLVARIPTGAPLDPAGARDPV
jgi:hypothetical protein